MPSAEETLKLLWGTTEPPKRGPKPSMSVRQIVDTAVKVADAEGLSAVSMHRVAKELGVTAMSLYRYIPGKDDLLELMFDASVGAPPKLTGENWRDDLRDVAWAQKRMYRARPWALELPITGPPMGPNNLAWMNITFEALSPTGVSEVDKLYVLLLISIYVRGESQLALGITQAEQRTGISEADRDRVYAELMQKIAHDDRFPALRKLGSIWADDDSEQDPDDDFEFGLQRILDGVEVLITRAKP